MNFFMSILGISIVLVIVTFLYMLFYLSTPKGCLENILGVYPRHVTIVARLFSISVLVGLMSAFIVTYMIFDNLI